MVYLLGKCHSQQEGDRLTSFRIIWLGIATLAFSVASSASAQRVVLDSVAVNGIIRSLVPSLIRH